MLLGAFEVVAVDGRCVLSPIDREGNATDLIDLYLDFKDSQAFEALDLALLVENWSSPSL